MKKVLVFILFQTVYFVVNSNAQENNKLLLSDYTFSGKRNVVGQVIPNKSTTIIKKVKLKGEDAGAFKVNNKHELVILPKFNKLEATWYNLVIETETNIGSLTDTFKIVNDQFIRNKVIAHRGAWKNTGATENSIAALRHAIDMGCEGSELDIHLSADSIPYVLHDHSIGDVNVEKSPVSVLSQVKLSNGEALPTLEDYIKAGITQNKTKLILEIKASAIGKERSIALTHKVLGLVDRLKAQAWVEYISFDYDVCKEIKKLDPFAKVAYLNGEKTPEELAAGGLDGLDYHFNVLQKNEDWIKRAHEKNLTVNVWTVNDPSAMDWFLERKVDFITTNEPEILLKKVVNK